jgi:hypothetical protein
MGTEKTIKPAVKEAMAVEPEKAWGKLERAREFAYSLYAKRGYVLGNELQVWIDAANREKSRKKSNPDA